MASGWSLIASATRPPTAQVGSSQSAHSIRAQVDSTADLGVRPSSLPLLHNDPDRRRRLAHVLLAVVLPPRPEEPAQAVLAVARHEMDVQVGDALADDV